MAAIPDILNNRDAVFSVQQPVRAGAQSVSESYDSSDVILAGDFRIDLESRSVTVRNRKLNLTWAEFDLLVFLTSHRKRIVSSHTRLATRSENHAVHQTDFLPTLLSLKRKLHEEVPGTAYINTEAWLLFEFHPGA